MRPTYDSGLTDCGEAFCRIDLPEKILGVEFTTAQLDALLGLLQSE